MKDNTETSSSSLQNVFDQARLRELVELMKEHDLSEIDLREPDHRIRLCRGPKEAPRMMLPAMAAPQAAAAPAAASAPASTGSAASSAGGTFIKSPMVGTFYSKPNPKAESYVKVGDTVDANTTICIIEAMKVFNEIPAEVRGKITAVLVEEGEAVEFDKPLFKIESAK